MGNPRPGQQPPRYTFFLNPYTDARFTRCPKCDGKRGRRVGQPLARQQQARDYRGGPSGI